jgi:hypothetical protein
MTKTAKSEYKAKKHLSHGSLVKAMSELFTSLPDSRREKRIDYSLHDSLLSGFACMFFQEPSLVQFQRNLQEKVRKNNLETLFKVTEVPEDTQLRRLVDSVASESLSPLFKEYFYRLQRGKHLEQFQIFKNQYLCSIDGTQYYSSDKIHCSRCLRTEQSYQEGQSKTAKRASKATSKTNYSHKVLQAAIIHPDCKQVVPLMPEEISNSDGANKQDCEISAFKRLLPKIRRDHPQLELILVGDGIYSRQSLIEHFLDSRTHYIFTAKEKDHRFLFDWVNDYDEIDSLSHVVE